MIYLNTALVLNNHLYSSQSGTEHESYSNNARCVVENIGFADLQHKWCTGFMQYDVAVQCLLYRFSLELC